MTDGTEKQSTIAPDRLGRLTENVRAPVRSGKGYTRFVRSMRLLLPLAALVMTVVIVVWPDMEEKVVPLALEDVLPDQSESVRNELLSPRFESTDQDQQPYTITAARAIQSQDNPELVQLEQPMADMLMKDGAWIAIEAKNGVYEQNADRLFLHGAVKLFHDRGYQLETDELRVDMKTRQAWSDKPVQAQGPEATLEAAGLEGAAGDGVLIFTGPAKLVLTGKESDLSLGKMMP